MEQREKELELYFHIPFCVRKCFYCDFLSGPGDVDLQAAYMDALRAEVRGRAGELAGYRVVSAFIGGGTPSVVAAEQLEALLDTVRACCRLAEDPEITVEVNPGTVDPEKLKIYRRAGINRLSIGLQSADDGELAAIGRIHTVGQFLATYEAAAKAGFSNVNVDVMSALPGQSRKSYRRTLEFVTGLTPQPTHISAYSLILEEGTPLRDRVLSGELEMPDEETDRLMYDDTGRILGEAGYRRYEISNYAREGYACRHNCGYWTRKNYVGFGVGAASLLENVRFRNTDDRERYIKQPCACREEIHALTQSEQMEEFMFLGLRLTEGVSVREFEAEFGRPLKAEFGAAVEENLRDGLLAYRDGGSRLALTERGLDLANYAMARFLL